MPFAAGPVLRYVGAGQYATVGPTDYVGDSDVIHVPADFPTDLASVPRVFWALIPPQGAYEAAAVLHDWLCVELAKAHQAARRGAIDGLTPPVNARDTDGLFRRVMREAGVPFLIRWVMWVGVRWGALANPARRAGWWRDAPLVVSLSVAGLAATLATAWAVHEGVDAVLQLLT
ncbi:DUF1353 domain-containing protein [Blastococcus sp. CT_GayMR16]|uniref:DUF1353 domain-containing protein n=1 Tax=Blastococcus sp. CT_GayMR16 TaxID=2559607 RepID=UPI001074724D|nr:DUF1353 domain-containing protein [Blastococcus sp. CT_GayMR16]TFV83173.1 DUF1353 domain-containing protein [Blastococcus sp. CT_GayMR16]